MVKERNDKQPDIHCVFSPTRRYRYVWRYTWAPSLKPCVFIGLNPSTADESGPDPTVRRCVRYAQAWGYGQLVMLNLFGLRATDPFVMKTARRPVGPANDDWLLRETTDTMRRQGIVVAAWGNHGQHRGRAQAVRELLQSVPLHCLTLTQSGEPGHPLYLPHRLRPQPI